jgi:hypothetical protein
MKKRRTTVAKMWGETRIKTGWPRASTMKDHLSSSQRLTRPTTIQPKCSVSRTRDCRSRQVGATVGPTKMGFQTLMTPAITEVLQASRRNLTICSQLVLRTTTRIFLKMVLKT